MHTKYSDGILSVQELLKMCVSRHLKYVAVTDHDTTKGCKEAVEVGKSLGLHVIPGLEMSTEFPGQGGVHMLGYFPIDELDEVETFFKTLQEARYLRTKNILDNLKEKGVDISYDRVIEIAGEAAPGRPHIAKAMLEKGYISTFQEAFNKYLGEGKMKYICVLYCLVYQCLSHYIH